MTEEQVVDQQSQNLFDEFKKHCDKVRKNYSSSAPLDRRIIFEGWAIQKISGLQCSVLTLEARIKKLALKKK